MKQKSNDKLPFAIGALFYQLPPALIRMIKRRFRAEGYRLHSVGLSTSKKELYSYNLIIVFGDSLDDEDEAFAQKCLDAGRLGPFDQPISEEEDLDHFSPEATLDRLLANISSLRYVYVASALLESESGYQERAIRLQERAQKRVEKDGFVAVNSIETDWDALFGQAEVNDEYTSLMVLAYENKKDFDVLMHCYQNDEAFYDLYGRAGCFLYLGKGATPLYALLSYVDHYDPHQLEDALRAADRHRG
jgi:hypothetical protein